MVFSFGWVSKYTCLNFSLETWVYIWVVSNEECPIILFLSKYHNLHLINELQKYV